MRRGQRNGRFNHYDRREASVDRGKSQRSSASPRSDTETPSSNSSSARSEPKRQGSRWTWAFFGVAGSWRLNAGHSVRAILEAGRLAGPIGSAPLKKSQVPPASGSLLLLQHAGALPLSTTERLRREAEVSGRAATQAPGPRTPPGPVPQRRSPHEERADRQLPDAHPEDDTKGSNAIGRHHVEAGKGRTRPSPSGAPRNYRRPAHRRTPGQGGGRRRTGDRGEGTGDDDQATPQAPVPLGRLGPRWLPTP